MCRYANVYVRLFGCAFVYVFAFVCVRAHACMYACVCVFVCVCLFVCMVRICSGDKGGKGRFKRSNELLLSK